MRTETARISSAPITVVCFSGLFHQSKTATMSARLTFRIFLLILTYSFVESFNITILHTNDIHARFEETNKYSGRCSDEDTANGKCFGGTARLMTKVRERRSLIPNTIFLSAGDEFSGTLWFYKYAGNVTAKFMNLLGYDVMALGNHEFDLGIDGLVPFLNLVNFSISSANIDTSNEPRIQGKVVEHVVLTVGGEKIGVIGYTTTETPDISSPGQNLKFRDEVVTLQKVVDTLTSEGINKIIALGHSGFDVDKKIAAEVTNLDVVVGGHTNTFLYTGNKPSNENPEGEYPHVVTQSNGAKVLVVQDYAYGKYLGELDLTFDNQGVITSWGGNPILLDNNTEQDQATLDLMMPYKEGVESAVREVVGKTLVLLDGETASCRVKECNLGNLIADAMVHQNLKHSDSLEWNDVAIAMVNGGGIRASILKGDVTIGDILTVQPFRNTADIIEIRGEHVKEALEYTASRWQSKVNFFGGFFQFSGMKVVYDMTQPVGQRVVEVMVRCSNCSIPQFEGLDPQKVYKIVIPSFIANGGDGYSMIRDNKIRHHLLGDVDADVFIEYAKATSPIIHGLEGRISFREAACSCPPTSSGYKQFPSVFALVLGMKLYTLYHML